MVAIKRSGDPTTPAAEWSRKVATALVAVEFKPTLPQMARLVGCWVLKRPYKVPHYMIEVRAMIRPDADVRFEIASVVAEIHR